MVRAVVTVGALILTVGIVTAPPRNQGSASASTIRTGSPAASKSFSWLRPAPAPATWPRVSTPSGDAVLSYPPSFTPFIGDPGTVSAALRTSSGRFVAYLNVTPKQGDEQLNGFAAFRVRLLSQDEDHSVHEQVAAEGLQFRGGQGSCVVDSYSTRIGANHYRETACYVAGTRGDNVIVAAAATRDWNRFQPILRVAISSFAVS